MEGELIIMVHQTPLNRDYYNLDPMRVDMIIIIIVVGVGSILIIFNSSIHILILANHFREVGVIIVWEQVRIDPIR